MSILVTEEKLRSLLYDILHGDEEHQEWLKKKIEEIVKGCKEFP